ncbi:fatty acid synthase-like [Mya arenaria]|uniref:fatty acid synthase-like n=1 Tax=Mya arenaria TaxID=6604 RepID=UPI0022DEA9BB|nr:fatty acid synthase-like [Mya arenaria]
MNPKGRGLVDWEGQGLGKMFSGYDNSGKRVIGFVPTGAMATKVYAEKVHQWRVLDSWSLQEASTVPLPYFQAYHALVQRAGIDKNKSVLVVGSGAEGRAGVAVAMQYACSVYVAAETDKHKIMLLEDFQDLKDWTFLKQDMHGEVLRRTNGQGVDIVFHCGEPGSLQTVCPLVRDGGSLMQCHTTGNVPADEGQGTVLISLLQRNCRLCHISIDRLDREIEHHAALLLAEGIDSGAVRPFSSKLFEVDKVHQAISYKEAHPSDSVVLKLGESKPGPLEVEAVTRLLLAPHKVYVVLGGLGELGLQLAHWLVQRGARKLLLTADSGKETGYEQRKLREWKKMGVTVMVSERITGTQFCAVVLITDAKKLGPVGGIFDIKMGEDCYSRVKNLETVVRDTCRSINWFIVFRRDSQSTELLEWCEGKIDENYKVQVIKLVDHQQIGCPSPWRLPPNDLEAAMLQDCTECDLCLDAGGTQERKAKNETTLECLCRLSGVLDMSSLEGSLSLNQLGLDILDIAELKLHVDKLAWFTSQELKHMKVEELLDLLPESTDDKKSEEETENHSMADLTDSDNKKLRPLLPSFSDQQMIVKLNSWPQPAMPVYIIYNDETVWEVLELARMVKAPVYGLHVTADTPTMSVNALAGYFLQNLCLNNNCEPFILIGHKFGCPVAIEMTLQLDTDDLDLVKQLICLEGSQMYVMAGENDCVSSKGEYDKDEMEEMALISFLQSFDVTSEEVGFSFRSTGEF